MDIFDENVIFNLAIEMDTPDMLNWCYSNKRINRLLCQKDNIWIYKLDKDFPYWRNLKTVKKYKDIYFMLPKIEKMYEEYVSEGKNKEDIIIFYNDSKLDIYDDVSKDINLLENLRRLNVDTPTQSDLQKVLTLSNLTHIMIFNGRNLKYLPKEIGNMKNLESLSITNHNFETLPKEIGELNNLKYLWLHTGKLRELPREIGNLTNLQNLTLDTNQLTTLPEEIGKLKNLVTLNLSYNKMYGFPDTMNELTSLKELKLFGSRVRHLPKILQELSKTVEIPPFN